MAAKPRGNLFYEICIVVLIAALIGAIIYPSRIWQDEEELESICRTRMETIQQLEYGYINKTSTYSDSIPKVITEVLSDPETVTSLDTLVFWDGLIKRSDLKQLVLEKQFPEALRNSMLEKLKNGSPLGNLGVWDSLDFRLTAEVRGVLAASESTGNPSIDSGVVWRILMGEDNFSNILDIPEISSRVRRRTVTAVQRGRAVFETQDWKQIRFIFYAALQNLIDIAETEDIWEEEEEDRWEEERRKQWESEMDMLSQGERDSLWQNFQQRFWEKDRELIVKRNRSRLWKEDAETWTEDNRVMWERILSQQWSSDRKRDWKDAQLASLPDSAAASFKAQSDSLWREKLPEIRDAEYETWVEENKKVKEELIMNLWERDKRVVWEDEAHQNWIEGKESDWDELWIEIKEEIWNLNKDGFWREEEGKLARKLNALKRLDQAVSWMSVLDVERVEALVNGLRIPDNQGVWKEIEKRKEDEGSSLNNIGIVDLFRNALLDSAINCPVGRVPYIINVVDTSVVKTFEIRCPIVVMDTVTVALRIDRATNDTTEVPLEIPSIRKLLGGGSIKNHGLIDENAKKSWDTKGR